MTPEIWAFLTISGAVLAISFGAGLHALRGEIAIKNRALDEAYRHMEAVETVNRMLSHNVRELQWWRAHYEMACLHQGARIAKGQEVQQ